jgi:hypothetical protein
MLSRKAYRGTWAMFFRMWWIRSWCCGMGANGCNVAEWYQGSVTSLRHRYLVIDASHWFRTLAGPSLVER